MPVTSVHPSGLVFRATKYPPSRHSVQLVLCLWVHWQKQVLDLLVTLSSSVISDLLRDPLRLVVSDLRPPGKR